MIARFKINTLAILRCLVLLGVMVRAMVPAGFMPAFASTGGDLLPLVICSGVTGDTTVYLPADQMPDQSEKGPQEPHTPAAHDAPCAFAAHFSLGTTAAPPQLPPSIFDTKPPVPSAESAPEAKRDSKSFLSQGPPVSLKFR